MFDQSSWVPALLQNNLEKTVVEDHKVDQEIIGHITKKKFYLFGIPLYRTQSNAKILSFSSKTKQITKEMLKESASLKEEDNLENVFEFIKLIPYILYWLCSKKDFEKEQEKYIKRKAGFKP